MTDSVVAEGLVKMRDGKKWRSRWVVLRKPSPVADCLVLLVYKERGVKERCSVLLEHICGLEVGGSADGVAFTLSILCLTNTAQLGFDSKEALLSWDLRLRYCLGEVHSFNVIVLPGTKLESGPATLHLCNDLLVIARDHPPVITGQWNLLDLRRYGPVTNGFVFEGGTRCGYWAGVFFLSCAEGEQISFLFDCIVRGVSPSRGPFGPKPLLPEPSANPALAEERLDQEAADLEKRLSLLSHCIASSSGSSVAGDDRSMSGSSHKSDTSHSGSSVGSLHIQWAEPAPPILAEMSFSSAARMASHGEENLSINVVGVPRVPSKSSPFRGLQEIGWQSSSDSGIATASHSSFSGSFSSYTASVEVGSPKEHSSLPSLPPPPNPENNLCTCPVIHAHEYQVPCSLRYLYDTPRRLQQSPRSPAEGAEQSGHPAQRPVEFLAREQSDTPIRDQAKVSEASLCIPEPPRDSAPSLPHRLGSSCVSCPPHPAAPRMLFTTCPICKGLKRSPIPPAATEQSGGTAGEKSASLSTGTTDHPTNQEQKNQTESSTASALTNHSPENLSSAEKRSPKDYMDSLSDLLGHYCSGKADMASFLPGSTLTLERYCLPGNSIPGSVRTSVYQHMSPALAPPPFPVPRGAGLSASTQHPSRSAIYENCLQCRRGQGVCTLLGPDPPATRGGPAHVDGPGSGRGQLLPPLHLQSVDVDPSETSSESQPAEDPLEAPTCSSRSPKQLGDMGTAAKDENGKGPVERAGVDPAGGMVEGRGTGRRCEVDPHWRACCLLVPTWSDEGSGYDLMGSRGWQRNLHQPEGCRAGPRGEGLTYVNVPLSPETRTQLHHMELEQSEPCRTARGMGSTKYSQTEITATDTAQRVSTQHALGREEGLPRLEQRKADGPPQ